jgi:hypothetical protein
MTARGVTEKRLFDVKLTASAVSAAAPGADVPVAGSVPICPTDTLSGVAPVVVNVSPRRDEASAEPASGPERKTAGSGWSPSRDATAISPTSRSGSSRTRVLRLSWLPSSITEIEGNARPRSVAGLGATASIFMKDVPCPPRVSPTC